MHESKPAIQAPPHLGVIPLPRTFESTAGAFCLHAETAIVVSDESLTAVATNFAGFLARATGFTLGVFVEASTRSGGINLRLARHPTKEEAYELEVSSEQVVISAATLSGVFYATQTLRQLLPPQIESHTAVSDVKWIVDGIRIADSPNYAYRGMHLDVSRHFFSVEFVMRFLDWMALHKLNTFHWHLTDDQGWRIEIIKYPRLTEIGAWREETVIGHTLGRDAATDGKRHGGYYTQDEIRQIVRYAADRFIRIIPEIDMPGHSSALLAAYPEFACRDGDFKVATHFGIFKDVLCPSEATFAMLADVLAEVAELFPGPYLHIGGDEADKSQWQRSDKCQAVMRDHGLQTVHELHRYFVARLDRIIKGLGKKLIAWDDAIDGGLDEPIAVVAWRGVEYVTAAARAGHDVVVSSGAFYFDRYQSISVDEPPAIHGLTTLRDVYEFEIMPPELDVDHCKKIVGAQGALWTEYIATTRAAEYMALPRMCALAEQVWSPASARNWNDFVARLRHHYLRLDAMNVRASRSVYNVRAETSLSPERSLIVVLKTDGDDHGILYTLDGSHPSLSSCEYESPLVLSQSMTVRASAVDRQSGRLYGDTRLSHVQHKALGCSVYFVHEPDDAWGGNPTRAVVDGLIGRDRFFLHEEWAGFTGGNMDAVIDLGVSTEISEAVVGFATAQHRRLYPPTGIEVSVSSDGESWRPVADLNHLDIPQGKYELTVGFERVFTRYVRVKCRNDKQAYSHETKQLEAVSLYVDEIAIH